ncbi:hypothetical protein GCM10007242_19580 [Pigmentiphaga litoralis]|jgi:hypothetical protein|nr:hypothetical protein GCM10007242_19580 [Pigmentiphaga litoralis]
MSATPVNDTVPGSLATIRDAMAPAAVAPGSLQRDAFGHLVYTGADGVVHGGVVPVRAFPIDGRLEDIALVGRDGHELAWIPRLDALDDASRVLIADELSQREFMPAITRIVSVSTLATPSRWVIETDRGPTELLLRSEQDIRRVAGNTLLIADGHGLYFLIRDLTRLDRGSKRLLDRFL